MVVIDHATCTLCRACVETCPASCLTVVANRLFISSPSCGACGQCIARCPQGALSWNGAAPRRIDRRALPSPENLEELFMARRSIRKFRDSAPDENLIDRLVKAAPMAPANVPDIELLLVTNPKTLRALESLALDRVEKKYLRFYNRPWIYDLARRLTPAVSDFDRARLRRVLRRGSLFYGAPALVLAVADPRRPAAEVSCHYALYNMILLAETLGLGTCLAGMAQDALSGFGRVRRLLRINKSREILGVLLLGYPDVEYPYAAGRDAIPVRRV
jgi:nitroreductase/NAD-dependent dihydropyrimidine dehydrogenase PreA subunit